MRNDVCHDGVGTGELAKVGQEQSQFDYAVERAAGRFDDGLHVGKRLPHLAFEVLGHQLAGSWLQADLAGQIDGFRSEEHTSELQSLMRISYAVFCLKKKNKPRPI